MKLKFKAEAKDIMYFGLFSIFLFFLISVGVGNITSLSRTGDFVGFNPLPGLYKENIFGTLLFFFISMGSIMALVSSYFFERESGFGFSKEKKQGGGYSKWAKIDDIKKAIGVKEVNESDYKIWSYLNGISSLDFSFSHSKTQTSTHSSHLLRVSSDTIYTLYACFLLLNTTSAF